MIPQEEQAAAALFARASSGDAAAYEQLLTLLAATSRRFVRNRVGAVPWLEDVVQETLVTVHNARRSYDPARPFAPWFYAILSSRLIDVWRKEHRVRIREVATDVVPDAPVAPPEPVDDLSRRRIEAALAALPPRQREIVSALKLRDESVKELSARLGMSPSAIKVAAHRGYRALRRLLGSTDR